MLFSASLIASETALYGPITDPAVAALLTPLSNWSYATW
jgi:hypothetical protein